MSYLYKQKTTPFGVTASQRGRLDFGFYLFSELIVKVGE